MRAAAYKTHCSSNLRQLALGVHLSADSAGRLPQGCGYPYYRQPRDYGWQCGVSWLTAILPNVEQTRLWADAQKAYAADPSGESESHARVKEHVVDVFLCPMEVVGLGGGDFYHGYWGVTSYVGVAGTSVRNNDGVFHKNFTVAWADITDGMSNTVMIGERPAGPNGEQSSWYGTWGHGTCEVSQIVPAGRNDWVVVSYRGCSPSDSPLRPGQSGSACDVAHFWSQHPSGAHFAFADGSVRFLSYSAGVVLPALATRAGNEPVDTP